MIMMKGVNTENIRTERNLKMFYKEEEDSDLKEQMETFFYTEHRKIAAKILGHWFLTWVPIKQDLVN